MPQVTIPASFTVVGKNYSVPVNIGVIQPAPPATITLSLTTLSGTGQARFMANNSSTMTISQTTSVDISGITESSTVDNMRLEAKVNNTVLASREFTVVEVTLTLRTTGQFSSDNAARNALASALGGSFDLGPRFASSLWRTVVEVVGTVKPTNFNSDILIDRNLVASRYYQESGLIQSENNLPDTSPAAARDDDPQPNATVYDGDGPGFSINTTPPIGTKYRRRTNFTQFARIGAARLSANLNWYSRIAIVYTSTGWQWSNDFQGDNAAGTGTTNLSWNLQ